jgi:hypothetical protein
VQPFLEAPSFLVARNLEPFARILVRAPGTPLWAAPFLHFSSAFGTQRFGCRFR